MKFTLVINKEKIRDSRLAGDIRAKLRDLGAESIWMIEYDDTFLRNCDSKKDIRPEIAQADITIALGGDGTILHVAKKAALAGKPVLGINAGRLGFMAGLEADETESLNRLFEGRYQIENRMMLEIRSGEEGKAHYALNEAVIANGTVSRMVDFRLFCSGRPINEYRADGMIVYTPTGSTAYNLSAGGPIIDTALESIGVTPICPHSLISRNVLFSSSSVICLRVQTRNGEKAYLSVDGEEAIELKNPESVTMKKSKRKVQLVKIKDVTFYEALNNKFSEKFR